MVMSETMITANLQQTVNYCRLTIGRSEWHSRLIGRPKESLVKSCSRVLEKSTSRLASELQEDACWWRVISGRRQVKNQKSPGESRRVQATRRVRATERVLPNHRNCESKNLWRATRCSPRSVCGGS